MKGEGRIVADGLEARRTEQSRDVLPRSRGIVIDTNNVMALREKAFAKE
jgi:hypothetical protein